MSGSSQGCMIERARVPGPGSALPTGEEEMREKTSVAILGGTSLIGRAGSPFLFVATKIILELEGLLGIFAGAPIECKKKTLI